MDYGLGEEEFEGADEAAFHGVYEGAFGVLEVGVEGGVAGFFAEFGGFGVEEFGWVGFSQEEETEDLDDAVGYGCCPEGPSPCGIFGDKSWWVSAS